MRKKKAALKLLSCFLTIAMILTIQFPGGSVFGEADADGNDTADPQVSQEIEEQSSGQNDDAAPAEAQDGSDEMAANGSAGDAGMDAEDVPANESDMDSNPEQSDPQTDQSDTQADQAEPQTEQSEPQAEDSPMTKPAAEDPIKAYFQLLTTGDSYSKGVDVTGYTLKVRLYDSNTKENLIAQADVPLDNSMLDTASVSFEMLVEDGVTITRSSDASGAVGYFVTYYIYDADGNLADPDEWENGEKYAYVNSSYDRLYWQDLGWSGLTKNDESYNHTKSISFLKVDAYESWTPDEIPHVTESSSGAVEFHPMTDPTQIQGGKHYIILTQSAADNEWYAFANNDTGYQVIMDSLSGKSYEEVTDPDFTYKMTANEVKSETYVYKAKDVSGKNLKLYTNQRDAEQKEIKLKLGWSSSSIEPIFSTSSGNITLEKATGTSAEWIIDHEGLNCLEYVPELFGGSFYGVSNTYGVGDPYAFNAPTDDGVNSLGGAKYWGGGAYTWRFLNHWPDHDYGYYYVYRLGALVMETEPEYDTPEYVALASSYEHPTSFIILTDAEITEPEEEVEDIPETAEEREYAPIEDLTELNAGDEIVIIPSQWTSYNKLFSNVRDDNGVLVGGDFTKVSDEWDEQTIRTSSDNAFILGADTGGTGDTDGHRKFSFLKECKADDPKYVRLVKDSDEIRFQDQEKSISFYTEAPGDHWNSGGNGVFYVRGNDSSCWMNYLWTESGNGNWVHTFANGTGADAETFLILKRQKYKINYHYVGEANDPDFIDEYDKTKADIWKTVYTGNTARVKTDSGEDTWDNWASVYTRDYKLLGWTTDPEQPAYLGTEDSCNLFEYDPTVGTGSLSQEAIDKYKLVGDSQGKFSLKAPEIQALMENSEDGKTLDLYPIFCKRGFSQPVSVKDSDGNAIVGAGDWKDYENLSPQEYDWYGTSWDESWLGKINVEVYKDGELWCDPLPLYYMYHNDNSADLNVKFIVDDLLDGYEDSYDPWGDPDDPPLRTQLDNYLLDGDVFPEASQVDDYVIDYVVAMQGSKEDGLKYRLNWMTESGGQLDNVRGGSTVKIYVTSKYQVKYFLDGVSWDEASGKLVAAMSDDGTPADSVELTEEVAGSDTWVNVLTYATTQTEEAAAGNEVDITVSEEENSGIFSRDTEAVDGDAWYLPPEEELRSTFGTYLYDINQYDHEIPTPEAPALLVPEGYVLDDGSVWEIRDEDGNTISEVPVSSSFLVHAALAGGAESPFAGPSADALEEAGFIEQAFKADADEMRTYHLHMKIKKENEAGLLLAVTKEWDDSEDKAGIRPSADAFAGCVTLLRDGEPVDEEAHVTDNGDGTYTIEYRGLPETDAQGNAYEYTVQETAVPEGYKVEGSDTAEPGGTIVNCPEDKPDNPDNPDEPDNPPDNGGSSGNGTTDSGNQNTSHHAVSTGDPTNIYLLYGVPLLALAVLIAVTVARRRKPEDR